MGAHAADAPFDRARALRAYTALRRALDELGAALGVGGGCDVEAEADVDVGSSGVCMESEDRCGHERAVTCLFCLCACVRVCVCMCLLALMLFSVVYVLI